MGRRLLLLPGRFAICRLPASTHLASLGSGPFFSVTRTAEELSVVCSEAEAPPGATVETGWRLLQVEGPLHFSETGVLASLATPLAEAGVPIFVVSTFDTDYLLVRERDLETARDALAAAGHSVAS